MWFIPIHLELEFHRTMWEPLIRILQVSSVYNHLQKLSSEKSGRKLP